MSENNGVIRIGRKGIKKFAFGDGPVFEVDVVVAFQAWINIDDDLRVDDTDGNRRILNVARYHLAAVEFVQSLMITPVKDLRNDYKGITTAEALDFIARLREQYEALVVFFRPKLHEEQESQDTSELGHQFSEEES